MLSVWSKSFLQENESVSAEVTSGVIAAKHGAAKVVRSHGSVTVLVDEFNDWSGIFKAMDVSNPRLSNKNNFAAQFTVPIGNHLGVFIPWYNLIGISVNVQKRDPGCSQWLE